MTCLASAPLIRLRHLLPIAVRLRRGEGYLRGWISRELLAGNRLLAGGSREIFSWVAFSPREGRRCRRRMRGYSLAITLVLAFTATAAPPPLRVCSDPNNLPFSNSRGEGFENKLAQLVARELGTSVSYYWFAQRRGFVRNTLTAGKCDVIVGVPSSFELALTTRPYYRSGYVFVTRRDRRLAIESLDDPRLRKLKI